MKKRSLAILVAVTLLITSAPLMFPQAVTPKTLAQTITGGFNNKINGWDVEAWADLRGVGTLKMDVYTDGSFSGSWGNSYNTLLRAGKKFPNNTSISSLGDISLKYDVSGFNSTHGATYMCVYGWTRNQMTEWYIIDDWKHWKPPSTTGGNYTNRGSITVDGGTYDIITSVRVNQPSIDGDKTFLQIFSIRRDTRSSGNINVSAHFSKWAEVVKNVTAGSEVISFTPDAGLYEVSFCIEGFGGDNPSSGGATVNELCVKWGGSNNYLCSYNGCDNCGRASGQTTPPTTTSPISQNYFFHSTFEGGNTDFDGWIKRGDATVTNTTAKAFAGSRSLLVSGRTEPWHGVERYIGSELGSGSSYSFSAMAMYTTGAASETFKLTLQYIDSDLVTKYDTIATATASANQWVQLANTSYYIPPGATEHRIYVETAGSTIDFYIDEMIGAMSGTVIVPPTTTTPSSTSVPSAATTFPSLTTTTAPNSTAAS
ncbi:MAG: glycoside hydrolase family 11 protein, partial [Oscillospiraceae bacterium]|nr:glycoside hydrolase family 11 protein [Oscillospiraceae bacterium]